ncbi:hypothetical protein [Bradyrhizobium sp. CB3481]|uniref:hypothetical protein n=1 Tax=Bradyrhizobium sp. CB3481 TaxID=3039158 RepID=UPI0024B27EFE|nr:hypothetical protein [Bradyrhizobium sp. CB3481]WFU18068.1 hypothetical protein QA643_06920 [Bradyrhizobium sp. CB3481]
MDQKNDKPLQHHRSKQLRERAFFFKRLAIGAADPKFSAKLQVLVDEYEREAARAKLELEQPATPLQTADADDTPERHTG